MAIMINRFFSTFVLSTLLFFFFSSHSAFAASTTMGFSPNTGSFGKSFTTSLVIDGHGDKFNAAQATVNISSNLVVKDLTFGDCNFSFLHTPSVQDPSFAGVIVSTSSTKCTVYTMTLVPIEKGDASITIAKASVRRYGDAVEVLSSTANSSFTLTDAQQSSTILGTQMKNTSQNGLYTLYIKVTTSGSTPVVNTNVILTSVSTKKQQQVTTDNNGIAHFSNLTSGIYDALVKENFIKVGETVVNINGPSHVFTIGINLNSQKNNPLMQNRSIIKTLSMNPLLLIGILLVGICIGIGIALIVIKILNRKK